MRKDDLCFKYYVQCGVYESYKKDHPCDMYHYRKCVNDSFIKWDNIECPVGNDEIEQFEEQNKRIYLSMFITSTLIRIVKQFYYTKEATTHKRNTK